MRARTSPRKENVSDTKPRITPSPSTEEGKEKCASIDLKYVICEQMKPLSNAVLMVLNHIFGPTEITASYLYTFLDDFYDQLPFIYNFLKVKANCEYRHLEDQSINNIYELLEKDIVPIVMLRQRNSYQYYVVDRIDETQNPIISLINPNTMFCKPIRNTLLIHEFKEIWDRSIFVIVPKGLEHKLLSKSEVTLTHD